MRMLGARRRDSMKIYSSIQAGGRLSNLCQKCWPVQASSRPTCRLNSPFHGRLRFYLAGSMRWKGDTCLPGTSINT